MKHPGGWEQPVLSMKRIDQIIYALFGGGALLYGAVNLLFPALLVKEAASSFPVSHILREQAAAAIFVGLMSLWCISNYERRRVVHYFLLVLAFLLAAIHWFDYLSGHLNWMAPVYNTVPFVVLLLMIVPPRAMSST